MKYYAVVVAGGSGNRMLTDTPKQFLLLNNLPVLMHTMNAFAESSHHPEILLVLNDKQKPEWESLCAKYHFQTPHHIIDGGIERFYSVKNAIDYITEESIVAIHDAVRPLVSKMLIDACFSQAKTLGNVVAAVPSSDSIRQLKENKTVALNRNDIYLVQTPQTFSLNVLKEAYKQSFNTNFTDDASVVEALGMDINIIPGERSNIKITYPLDLKLAELLLKEK